MHFQLTIGICSNIPRELEITILVVYRLYNLLKLLSGHNISSCPYVVVYTWQRIDFNHLKDTIMSISTFVKSNTALTVCFIVLTTVPRLASSGESISDNYSGLDTNYAPPNPSSMFKTDGAQPRTLAETMCSISATAEALTKLVRLWAYRREVIRMRDRRHIPNRQCLQQLLS
jgi:hypothetical protein